MKNNIWSNDYQEAKKNFNKTLSFLKSKEINVSHYQLDIDELDLSI